MQQPFNTKPGQRLSICVGVLIFLLGGCASYEPNPLSNSVNLAPSVDALISRGSAAAINSADGLNPAEVADLAIRNNPDLKAQRKRLGVAHVQLYAAGLLPDPQLSANLDVPTGSVPGVVNAFGIGLSYDIIPLINRSARIESEDKAVQQVTLDLLWQEWQVSQQARSLTVRLAGQRRQMDLLRKMHALYLQRYRQSSKALAQGDLTLDVAGTDLTALLDILSQINQLTQTDNDDAHALHLLLGLAPEAPLQVHLPPMPPLPDPQTLHRQMKELPLRRPDLLALQAGYHSQEAKVRAAILSQFPSISIGISRVRDTGNLYTDGFSIGLNLPLFSGNRGAIAVERATREQLLEEYQARLDQAEVDVDRLIHLQGIITLQQQQLDTYLPTLEKLVDRGREPFRRGDIDALTFLNMETTWIRKRQEKISLDQAQRENLIALQTVLAMPGDSGPGQVDVPAEEEP